MSKEVYVLKQIIIEKLNFKNYGQKIYFHQG